MLTRTQKGLERQQFSFREFVHGEPAHGRGHTEDAQRHAERRARNCGGIHGISGIKDRCVINAETGCWDWKGATNNSGTPIMWIAGLRSRVTLGIALCYFKTGAKPPRGTMWLPTCGNQCCGNPRHRAEGDASVRAQGKRTPLHDAKIKQANRLRSKLSEGTAMEIRESDEPARRLADAHDISISHVYRIRRGENWKPIVIPGSSIFNLGG